MTVGRRLLSTMTVIGAFTLEQAAKLSRASEAQLRHWHVQGIYRPYYADEVGKPFGRIYSFRDVVALRTIAKIRNDFDVSLHELRKLGQWLEETYDAPWSTLKFFVAGRHVYFHDPEIGHYRQGSRPLQTVQPFFLEEVVTDTASDAARMRQRPAEEYGKTTTYRYMLGNQPVIAGTRIPIKTIVAHHTAGYTTEQILQEFPSLTKADVEAALSHRLDRDLSLAS